MSQEIRIQPMPCVMHEQLKNLSRNTIGIPVNQFLIKKFRTIIDSTPVPFREARNMRQHNELRIYGMSDLMIQQLTERAAIIYGLPLNDYLKMLIRDILDEYPEHDKQRKAL